VELFSLLQHTPKPQTKETENIMEVLVTSRTAQNGNSFVLNFIAKIFV